MRHPTFPHSILITDPLYTNHSHSLHPKIDFYSWFLIGYQWIFLGNQHACNETDAHGGITDHMRESVIIVTRSLIFLEDSVSLQAADSPKSIKLSPSFLSVSLVHEITLNFEWDPIFKSKKRSNWKIVFKNNSNVQLRIKPFANFADFIWNIAIYFFR